MCNIIDELLNIELYRRNFQFNQPVIPEDDASDAEDLPEEETGENQGSPDKVISTKKNSRLVFQEDPFSSEAPKNLQEFSIKPEETKVGFYPREDNLQKDLEFKMEQKEEN